MTKERATSRKLLGWSLLGGYTFAVYFSVELYMDGAGIVLSALAFPSVGSVMTLTLCGITYLAEQYFTAGRAERQAAVEFVMPERDSHFGRSETSR